MRNNYLNKILIKNKKYTFLAIITKIIFSGSVVLTSLYLSILFDSYSISDAKFNKSIIAMFLIIFMTVIFSFISDYFKSLYIKKTNIDMKKIIDEAILSKSEELITNKNTGKNISWYTNDVDEIENKYFGNVIDVAYYIALIVFSTISIASLHWSILLASIVLFLLSLILPSLVSKYIYASQKRLTEENEQYTESVRDNLESLNLLFISNKLNLFRKKMYTSVNRRENEYFKYNITNAKVNSLMIFVSLISQIGLIVFALYIASLGYTTQGSVISVASLSGNLFNGIQAFISSITILKSVRAISDKYEINEDKNNRQIIDIIDRIVVDNVSFSYQDKKIFEDFSFKFERKKYALIGESGSGKSTLLKLILGIEKPLQGNILVGENNLSDINRFSYYKNISYIEQDIYFMNDSIKNNILLGSEISNDEFLEIIDSVNLGDFIASLPQKENTIITSNGQQLSGGEKQRIAIARALVKKAEFLFIDESTSQLDKKNREEIQKILLHLNDIGIIMITHNFNDELLEEFDEVINLNVINEKNE